MTQTNSVSGFYVKKGQEIYNMIFGIQTLMQKECRLSFSQCITIL